MRAKITEDEFIRLFPLLGAAELARRIGTDQRRVLERRRAIEKRRSIQLIPPTKKGIEAPSLLRLSVDNGIVLVGSDSHFWPGVISAAHRAFLKAINDLSPKVIIKNGDELDGATISRFPPTGREKLPTLLEELETVKDRLLEIETAAAGTCPLVWTLGNHDARYESRLASEAPEFLEITGTRLKDFFPNWAPTWGVVINESAHIPTVVKHRFKGGVHAAYNNTLHSGVHMVTGHLHSLKVTPITDYRGTRFGVDCGMIAPVYGGQFRDYTEENPRSWRSGFAVLSFWNGELVDVELLRVVDEDTGLVVFRGEVYRV